MDSGIVVTALDARTNFSKLLRRVEDDGQSVVIEKRGSPRAVLLSVRDYVRLAVPEPEVLRMLGMESKSKGTNRLSTAQIDQIVKAASKSKRPYPASAGNRYQRSRVGSAQAGGMQRTVILLAMTKPARWYVSDAIVANNQVVLPRPELKIRRSLRLQLLQLIENQTRAVTPSRLGQVTTSDPADNMFVECADAARADYLITGNPHHFPTFWKNTKIITSSEFMRIIAPPLFAETISVHHGWGRRFGSGDRPAATGIRFARVDIRVQLLHRVWASK
jgi:prevent-host-death family protein